eukprot:4129324-Pleurochrysis_carterae.AAC.2
MQAPSTEWSCMRVAPCRCRFAFAIGGQHVLQEGERGQGYRVLVERQQPAMTIGRPPWPVEVSMLVPERAGTHAAAPGSPLRGK